MKTSKLFLFGMLVLALFMVVPAMAYIPVFTGNVEVDFPALPDVLVIADPGGQDVTVEDNISGWDIKDIRLAYDVTSDTMYVGINSYGIVGDVDGDGDPDSANNPNNNDEPDLEGTESVAVYFDLDMLNHPDFDMSQSWDVIVGVGSGMAIFDFGIYNTNGKSNPSDNFGTPITGHDDRIPTNPSAASPDFEFSITDFSTLLEHSDVGLVDEVLGQFRVGAYMGSSYEGAIDDYVYYHQNPSTKVAITPSALSVVEGGTVDLNVTEQNDSTALRSQILGPYDPCAIFVELPLRNVKVEIMKNGPLFDILMDPSDSGDDGNYMLDIGETWLWMIPSVTITEYTEFVAIGYGFSLPEFLHTYPQDPNERAEAFVEIGPATPENEPPVANASETVTQVNSTNGTDAEVTLDGTLSFDTDGDTLTYSWSENGTEIATGETATVTLPVGEHIITLTVDDGNGGSDAVETTINVIAVNNDHEGPHAFVSLYYDGNYLFPRGTDVILEGYVTDYWTGGFTIVSAEYSLNGGAWTSIEAKDGAFDSPDEAVTVNLGQLPVGIYRISIRGTDSAGNVTEPIDIWSRSGTLGVYDPDHPIAVGAGEIDSPAGAFESDPSFYGQALFGFVSDCDPSVKKPVKPEGSTEFIFQFGELGEYIFHSSSCKKVQVIDTWEDKTGVKFLGEGTMNGVPGFKFMIRAIDSGEFSSDIFAIKIWTEAAGEEYVIYSNDYVISRGSEVKYGEGGIVIGTPGE